MQIIEFRAMEYQKDTSFREVSYRYEGEEESGWRINREGVKHLDLPKGYRLLRSLQCGICSTDLARHHLPFPLPQITGHEVIARDESGGTVAPEINASHLSTGSADAAHCTQCRHGRPRHCPERLVLGIDRLPGGFAPWILVPEKNVVQVPSTLSLDVSVLIEPFAAALHATRRMDLDRVKRVGVLGTGRLGLLLLAALHAARDALNGSFSIEAINRSAGRLEKAIFLGADATWRGMEDLRSSAGSLQPPLDVVIESTGSPQGLETALALASREVHVKSTTGRETLGMRHLTELVVDEISVARFEPECIRRGSDTPGPSGEALVVGSRVASTASGILEETGFRTTTVGQIEDFMTSCRDRSLDEYQVDLAVVDSVELLDLVIRPWPDREWGIVKPCGTILVADVGQAREGLLEPLLDRGIRLSTSRCGDFHKAIPSMEALQKKDLNLGDLVTSRFPASELEKAFEQARSPESLKIVVDHGNQ